MVEMTRVGATGSSKQASDAAIAERTARIHALLRECADEFARQRPVRQRRRELDPRDFDRLREAGFLLTGVPRQHGGIWQSNARSTRPIAEMLRTLAHGDSSVALVASMHPAVMASAGWLTTARPPAAFARAWQDQRAWVFQTIHDGAWWGTIVSEPGSGGDARCSKAMARPEEPRRAYRLTGEKHFGSGCGIASYMITMAIPKGEAEPDGFVLDMRGVPWDGSAGVMLVAPWDGHGMIATQSHALRFDEFPAVRYAWPASSRQRGGSMSQGFVPCLWAGVMVGIVETAIAEARRQLGRARATLRAFEQVEWERVEIEGWLVEQAYEGMLRAAESGTGARAALTGKVAIAELAESALARLCRVIGGGAYSRTSPFGFWFEDVRALGFLRPPWGLAFAQLSGLSWGTEAAQAAGPVAVCRK